MKWIVLLLGTLAGAGCHTFGVNQDEVARMKSEETKKSASPPPRVKPDELTEENAREVLRRLEAEVRHDEASLSENQ